MQTSVALYHIKSSFGDQNHVFEPGCLFLLEGWIFLTWRSTSTWLLSLGLIQTSKLDFQEMLVYYILMVMNINSCSTKYDRNPMSVALLCHASVAELRRRNTPFPCLGLWCQISLWLRRMWREMRALYQGTAGKH